jgi:hypothetical protein
MCMMKGPIIHQKLLVFYLATESAFNSESSSVYVRVIVCAFCIVLILLLEFVLLSRTLINWDFNWNPE